MFFLFLLISILVHLLILSALDIKPEPERSSEPVNVTIIPKKKPAEKQQETARPPAKPAQPMEDIPLDEELETKVDQTAPVMKEKADKKKKSTVPDESKPAPEKSAETEKKDKEKKQAEKEPETAKAQELKSITGNNEQVNLPEVSEKELTQKKIDKILDPKDVIAEYAEKGGMPEGEDHVSMQYVKLRYQSYFYKFSRRLYQVWLYPRSAAMRGEQGTVRISFVISRDGMISGINVIESSGYPDLDKEAVTALKKTAGVPLPESYELDFLKVDAYFQYILGGGFVVY